MRINPRARKQILCLSQKLTAPLRELLAIRGDTTTRRDAAAPFDRPDLALKIMKKNAAALLIVPTAETLTIGRAFNNEFIDLIRFKILEAKGTAEFPAVPAQSNVRYATLIQGVADPRLANLVVDTLSQQSNAVCLAGLRYAWVFAEEPSRFVLKYVRIRPDASIETVGPFFSLALDKAYHCGEELWAQALAPPAAPLKRRKNISKSALKETIGKIHIDKQDLRDIRLRKTGRHKKQVAEAEAQ